MRNTLGGFSAYHFNNSIIYKAILPSIIPHESFLMNIDAGILPGNEFAGFLREIDESLCASADSWIIGAHCHATEDRLPAPLSERPHNCLYSAGNILLFNTAQYERGGWYNRYVSNYLACQSYLKYAEQELICLTATEGELIPLPGFDRRITPFLGLEVFYGKAERLPTSCAEESLFFKFVGSLKPWKYWVLDPNKSLYTRRRAVLEEKFQLSGIPLIERNRMSAPREDYIATFMKAYDPLFALFSSNLLILKGHDLCCSVSCSHIDR